MDPDVQALVEAVESSFSVKFAPLELTDDSSLAELCLALRAHVTGTSSRRCFTSVTFWRLRRAAIQLFGLPKSSVRPSTPIELILPMVHRRRAWLALGEAAGLRLAGLEYSSGFCTLILWGAAVPATTLTLMLGGGWWVVLGGVLWFASFTALFHLCKPFAATLPFYTRTVGDLARTVVGLNYGKLASELGVSNESELADAVRHMVADLIDVDPRELVDANPRLIDLVLASEGFRAAI